VVAFERASGRVRAELDLLFGAPAPLPPENVGRIRAILDDLGVRPLIEREIESHRDRALHLLRGLAPIAASEEPLRLLEDLVMTSTGSAEHATAASA
jgi:hypothetical protein